MKKNVYFGWFDDKMYCLELVWEIHKQATELNIGELQKLKNFDLSNNEVKKILKSRFGKNIPLDEKNISTISIFNFDLLRTVKEN